MSVLKPIDGWDRNAGQLLRAQLFNPPDKSIDYAPDFRNGQPGPLTIQITEILRRHADLWAQDMRERSVASPGIRLDGATVWIQHMTEAHASIRRLTTGHTIGHGAAA